MDTPEHIDNELLLLRVRAYRIVKLVEESMEDLERLIERIDKLKQDNDNG